jgi:hypothetical protein
VPFEPWHFAWLAVQEGQQPLWTPLTPEYGVAMQQGGPCFSAFVGTDVIACAGVLHLWNGRAQVWSLLSDRMPEFAKPIHKAVKDFLTGFRVRRLECTVDPQSERAIRWAEHLGFRQEGFLSRFTPNGDDQLMMVRIQ